MTPTTYRKLLYRLQLLAEKGEKEPLKFMRHCKELPLAEIAPSTAP
jgi:hypothetical protein